MTLFTTSIRLINASIKGAITGAKDAITLEKQFMAWESELETLEVFDGYQGWIQQEDCINCDNKATTHGLCDICYSHNAYLYEDECMNCYNSNQDEIVADFLSDENQTEVYCKRGFGCNHDDATATCIGCDNIIKYDICEPFCKECIAESHKKKCIVCNTLFISGEHDTCSPCNSQLDLLGNKMLDHYEDGEEDKANRLGDLYFSLTTGLFVKSCIISQYHMDTCCIEATGVCNCDLPF